jgi:hypothetical protein
MAKRPTKRAVQKAVRDVLKDRGKLTKKEAVTIRKLKESFMQGDGIAINRRADGEWVAYVGAEVRELPPFLHQLAGEAYELGKTHIQNGLCKMIGAQRADGRA